MYTYIIYLYWRSEKCICLGANATWSNDPLIRSTGKKARERARVHPKKGLGFTRKNIYIYIYIYIYKYIYGGPRRDLASARTTLAIKIPASVPLRDTK